jgi:16S rRNA (guanine527-N7)-methyltransferase
MTCHEVSVLVGADVSRETVGKLLQYGELIKKWNPAINLVSKSTIPDVWDRHIVDSLQLFPALPLSATRCLDIGSGAGLPGLVLAIISAQLNQDRVFTLVESDQRKCAFLREAARALGLQVAVLNSRVEGLKPFRADVLSARALAPLSKLLAHAVVHLAPDGVCLFSKGEMFSQEIAVAKELYEFQYEVIVSKTDPNGVILKVYGIKNV